MALSKPEAHHREVDMKISSPYFTVVKYDGVLCTLKITSAFIDNQCVVDKLYIYIREAKELSQRYGCRTCFNYYGYNVEVRANSNDLSVVGQWVRSFQTRLLQKPRFPSPSFMRGKDWIETVVSFHKGDTRGGIYLALRIGNMLGELLQSSTSDPHNVDQCLNRYWSAMTFYAKPHDLDTALVALSMSWKEEFIGERICAWKTARENALYRKFGLNPRGGSIQAISQ